MASRITPLSTSPYRLRCSASAIASPSLPAFLTQAVRKTHVATTCTRHSDTRPSLAAHLIPNIYRSHLPPRAVTSVHPCINVSGTWVHESSAALRVSLLYSFLSWCVCVRAHARACLRACMLACVRASACTPRHRVEVDGRFEGRTT